jgi:hypothetical protein
VKLGEFFVKKGVITQAQLEEALKAHLIFGGHLGTCLIEFGFVDEPTLGRTLAELFGVDYAPPQFLTDIPKSTIDLLPKRLAEKHQAVPFQRRDKTLHVAMINPKNLPALDEIAFATGLKISPWVSPEVRIFQVLERYYDLPRRQRYISVCQNLDASEPGARSAPATVPAREAHGSAYAATPYLSALGPAVEPGGEDGIPSAPPMHARPSPTPSHSHNPSHADPQAALSDALCHAESASDIAAAALDHASRSLARSAFFLVKGTTATLWRWSGPGWEAARGSTVNLSVTSDPPFDLLLGRDHYLGPLPGTMRHRAFYEPLGVNPPSDVLLIPGYLDDRLIVVLYGDGGAGPLRPNVVDLDLLVRKLACSLQLVLIKKKIRSLEPAARSPEDETVRAA